MKTPALLGFCYPGWFHGDGMRTSILAVALLAASAPALATDVYKWVDEDGRIHYGDRPAGESAEAVEIEPRQPGTDPELEQRRDKRDKLLEQFADERRREAEEAERLAAEKAQRKRECTRARDQLWQYEHAPYLYDTNDDGERRILSDAERAAEENKLRRFLENKCP